VHPSSWLALYKVGYEPPHRRYAYESRVASASPDAEGDAHARRNRTTQHGHCYIRVCLAGFLRQPYGYGVHGSPTGSPNDADYYTSASVTEMCCRASDSWAGARVGRRHRG